MLSELIERYGEPWCYNHQYDFGVESADKLADIYNHGGLTLRNEHTREFTSVAYVSIRDGVVTIGCWVWQFGKDFDSNAEWFDLSVDWFYPEELKSIENKIKEIYGKD